MRSEPGVSEALGCRENGCEDESDSRLMRRDPEVPVGRRSHWCSRSLGNQLLSSLGSWRSPAPSGNLAPSCEQHERVPDLVDRERGADVVVCDRILGHGNILGF